MKSYTNFEFYNSKFMKFLEIIYFFTHFGVVEINTNALLNFVLHKKVESVFGCCVRDST